MKLSQGIALLQCLIIIRGQEVPTYTCPIDGSTTSIPAETLVRIPIVTDANNLCTLIRHNATGGGSTQRAPVARSYAARGSWEVSAGLFSNTATSGLTINCGDDGGETTPPSSTCNIFLPPITPNSGEEYILETSTRPSISSDTAYTEDELKAARFLEQSTFGPTVESISQLVASGLDFESWLTDQMYNLPKSSLRQYYRKRVNPKFEFPYRVGAVGSGPCVTNSRWRMYAISSRDMLISRSLNIEKYLTIEQVEGVPGYLFFVDGEFRTVVQDPPTDMDSNALMINTKYKIENVGFMYDGDCVGCPISIEAPGGESVKIPNPAVSIAGVDSVLPLNVLPLPQFKSESCPSIESSDNYPLFNEWIKSNENALLNTTSLNGMCDDFPDVRKPLPFDGDDSPGNTQTGTFPSVFGTALDAETGETVTFLYDRHLTLYENTVENPISDGGGSIAMSTHDTLAGEQVKCHNVHRNFYNEEHCKLSNLPTACEAYTEPKEVIVLNDENIEGIRATSGKDLYVVAGLTLLEVYDVNTGKSALVLFYIVNSCYNAPCAVTSIDQRSRWIRDESDLECENVASLGVDTLKIYQQFVDTHDIGYLNEDIVDVIRDYKLCNAADESKTFLGKVKASDGLCWHHVHPSEMNVVDLTGANETSYTISGNVATITSMDAFNNIIATLPIVGSFGDHVDITSSTVISPLNDQAVQDEFKTLEYNPQEKPVLICGSPFEVANDPSLSDHAFDIVLPDNIALGNKSPWELASQKHNVWTTLALNANDQLRLKMAWSLSQIIVVGRPSTEATSLTFVDTEGELVFYDSFVQIGFGNYRDLMKQFSFSVIMANWLSYNDNQSLQYSINKNKRSLPDENYARELMQLFTIGLVRLNMDGTSVLQNGTPEETYSQDDIVSYARAWTGFLQAKERGGASSGSDGDHSDETSLDPMWIDIEKRDLFPKTNLIGGFIGDKVALCANLPAKHFLRKGATYQLLGGNGKPELHDDPSSWTLSADFKSLEIESSSPLYSKLCEVDSNTGDCTLPSKVVLDTNLVYDDMAKLGIEYAVDTIRTVKMKVGSTFIWYEYVRQPCVEHSFYRDAKKVTISQIKKDKVEKANMCANPRLEAATPMCAPAGWETTSRDGHIFCNYQGERMTYDSSSAICQDNGMEQAYPQRIKEWACGPCCDGLVSPEWWKDDERFRSWSNSDCGLRVKVELSSGQVAIVHSPGADRSGTTNVENHVGQGTLNFFSSPWQGGVHPSMSDCLAIPSCEVHGEEYCICDIDTTETLVYSSASQVSSIDQLMAELHIGSVDPVSFDDIYTDLGSCNIVGVTVYSKTIDSCDNLQEDAIFAFEWNSKQFYLQNSKSTVSIPESNYSFRNPVQFISLADPEVRDAYHETDEVLDSLFYHPSHPPFLAVRIIQRFGVSNPSPNFVERVATAYKTGSYGQFGAGTYGDLGAMTAAILLDDESRALVLDTDQSHGHLREPLIKVTSLFRSLGLKYEMPESIPMLMEMVPQIGQGSFEQKSVFSFFLPEFTPPGMGAGLVAPESMVLHGSNILGLLDSYYSTVKFGIVECHGMNSFSSWGHLYPFSCPDTEGDTSSSPARISYQPTSNTLDGIIDELDLLLTAGRLQGSDNRALIRSTIEPMMGDIGKATRAAQQLILSTPEHHSTNLPKKITTAREIGGQISSVMPKASYKAIVVLMLLGGCDSFNMLLPTGQCSGSSDSYEEYLTVRGEHAISKENLLTITSSGQACTEFGINSHLPILADLYNSSEALFFANTGSLAKLATKHEDYKGGVNYHLFAHNSMQDVFYRGDTYGEKKGTGVMGRMLDILSQQEGLQTSANNVNNGMAILSGNANLFNPIHTVSTKSTGELNKFPTVDNLLDVVKELNGVGEVGNNMLSEYWSSRVASALFEHELEHELLSMPEFDVSGYPTTNVQLTSSFKAVAGYMKSREYRKVNRDVFVVSQSGYDMHNSDRLAGRFGELNNALADFIQEIKSQGLWGNTVIVQGSDFGRSMNPNSNGGTDHAWGGNYFMIGGSVNGGKILGSYPTPLGPESDYWLPNGRWIPTTPWESIFNGIAEWMGVHDDANLNEVLPNRESFDTCSLFTDNDLFTNGACQCVVENGIESTVCEDVTYSPTITPSISPTVKPTDGPSSTPTADIPDDAVLVKSIITPNSDIQVFGCTGYRRPRINDEHTDEFFCERDGINNVTDTSTYQMPGIIVTPEKMSIAKGLRVYANKGCKGCDPTSYILECRADTASDFYQLFAGDLAWKGNDWNNILNTRNIAGMTINSSYASGDTTHNFMEVKYPSNGAICYQYKLSFPDIRVSTSGSMKFAELELPGALLPPQPSTSPTPVPSVSPTNKPSASPLIQSEGSIIRKVRVQLTNKNILHMREVEVYNTDGVNVALEKAALQSSTMDVSTWPASKGVDGNLDNLMQTNSEQGAWWEVDLGPTDAIAIDQFKEVRIYNRGSGKGHEISRLSNAEVSLLNESGGIISQYTFGSVYWHEITLSAFDFGIGPTSSTSLGTPVNSVLVHYSIKSSFGCINSAVARVDDMLIYDYWCDRTGLNIRSDPSYQVPGITVKPERLSIAKGIRLYPNAGCKGCDPTTFELECRADAASDFSLLFSGTFAWKGVGWNDSLNTRNPKGRTINSSFESGDTSLKYMEVLHPTNRAVCYEYRLSFPETRSDNTSMLKFSEVELPGFVLPAADGSDDNCPDGMCMDLARRGTASQSSTCYKGYASRAIDGNTDGQWKRGSVQHTCQQTNGWWKVDLEANKLHTITKVKIYNRSDCCKDRLDGKAEVQILDDEGTVVASQPIQGVLSVYTFDFNNIVGRSVRVQKTEYGNMQFAEVRVIGNSVDL